MKVCLISVEIFAWGKFGGFGRATRIIGRELVKRGISVTAVVPRRENQKSVEFLDGMKVLSFKPADILGVAKLYKEADADIYHSQEPSLGTYLAKTAMPDRKHVVTFRDPRDPRDWRVELRMPSLSGPQVIKNWLYEDNFLVQKAVRKADGLYAAAEFLIPKARQKYKLDKDPIFLPSPVEIKPTIQKAAQPTVCFVSRWDKRKRPEIFFELVKEFPQVRFIAAGKSRNKKWDQYLWEKYSGTANLEMLGFVDQFESNKVFDVLESSWVLVNTAAREGLPNVFIEAAAHQCAILSAVDPDGFTSNYGYFAQDGDFARGLSQLLADDLWKKQAEKGHAYVRETFSIDRAIDRHIAIYQGLCKVY